MTQIEALTRQAAALPIGTARTKINLEIARLRRERIEEIKIRLEQRKKK